MKSYYALKIFSVCAAAALCGCQSASDGAREGGARAAAQYDVAAYVWPAYQNEPRWKELGIFADGKGEWQNVYEATPKRAGHMQPLVPLWGYEMDDDPVAMEKQIDAASGAGLNVFIYDWYWYGGRPFLENALNNGFLGARNNGKMRFFLMWANHDVNGLWNNKAEMKDKNKTIWSADVSLAEFKEKLAPRWIAYFKKPNYYKIDGRPVVSIYEPRNLVRGMGGSWANVREAFEYLGAEAKKAGLRGVHIMLNSAVNERSFRQMNLPDKAKASPREIAEYLKFDSFTTYNWVCEIGSALSSKSDTPYAKWVDLGVSTFDKNKAMLPGAQYFPHVSLAWDTNPRFLPKNYMPTVCGCNPQDFERGLRAAKAWIDKNARPGQPKLITVNAWNEWTEGCYLQPDKLHGYGFLNAIARVFGGKEQAQDGNK